MKRLLQILCAVLVLAACTNQTPPPSQPTQVVPPVTQQMPAAPTTPAETMQPMQPTATPPPVTAAPAPSQAPAETPPSGEAWTRHEFGTAWSLEVPSGWEIQDAGAHEGALGLKGDFEGNHYAASLSYPIFESFPSSLDIWVEQSIQDTLPASSNPTIVDTTVAGTPAKIVRGIPTPDGPSDQVYIWSGPDRNPRRIGLTQLDGDQHNPDIMAHLLDRLLAGIGA